MSQSAKPTVHGILTVDLPNPAMTAVVTDLSFARRHLTDSNVSVAAIYSGWRAGDLTNLYQELLKVRNAHEAAGQQTLSDRQVMADSCRYPVGKHLFPDGLRRSS